MTPEIEILADSTNAITTDRFTTFLLRNFPKCLLAQLNTHRLLSRNCASSRAIPVSKVLEQVRREPFMPEFQRAQKGMVGLNDLSEDEVSRAKFHWLCARDEAVFHAENLMKGGIAKQHANRLLEPWMTVPVIVSATEWDNFFKLRTASDAQPEFRAFAQAMQNMRRHNKPKKLNPGQWHVPLATATEDLEHRLVTSTAWCARGSYGVFSGESSFGKDQKLHDKLLASGHWSPFEHQARCMPTSSAHANLRGWQSYRTMRGF